jgi:4a-hydroxytetrahydrobiopterin dehydratase
MSDSGPRDLAGRRCVPCEKGTPPLTEEEAAPYLPLVPGWELRDGKSIRRRFRFKRFLDSMAFVNRIAEAAESECHHPDIFISYDRVRVDLTTHAINGLSENDFIMAAKIDSIAAAGP